MSELQDRFSKVDIKYIMSAFERMGYKFFTKGNWNLNIFGIRSSNKKANLFDDLLVQVYKDDDGEWCIDSFQATTDPGTRSLKNPGEYGDPKRGTAIYVPGQYRSVYKIGPHRNKYTALRLDGNIKVYRDNNRDNTLDFNPDTIQEGNFYCNIHHAGENSTYVENWSAGCQVIRTMKGWNQFMKTVYKCADEHAGREKERFTYTLFTESQFFGDK